MTETLPAAVTDPRSADLAAYAVRVGSGNVYAGTVTTVRDGDTVHVAVLDPLLSTPVVLSVRVAGVNCPELSQPGGTHARDALAGLLPAGAVVTLARVRPDKYAGRVDADITRGTVNVAGWLVANGYAVRWDGVGPKPSVPWPPVLPAPAG